MTDPFSDLIDESFDEAMFLWGRWEQELSSLTRSLDEIDSWTEDRLHGALDGVRVAGDALVDLLSPRLHGVQHSEIVVAAGLLGSTASEAATSVVAAALQSADRMQLDAMLRGLELLGTPPMLRAAARVLAEGSPAHAAGLCRLKFFRRVAGGDEIARAFESKDIDVQVSAVRAAALTTTPHGRALMTDAMEHENAIVSAAAVEQGIACGWREAWEMGRARAARLDQRAAPYLKLVALTGSRDDHEIIYSALRIPSLQVPAIWALGHLGTTTAAEACLAGMRHETLARAAGEAYCWITGTDLERDRLAVSEPPPESPAFEEDDLDANLVPPPDAWWPKPDPVAVSNHWQSVRARFTPDVRHIHGKPVGHETLMDMVEGGPMLRRPDLIFELRARSRDRYDVEPRAFADRQRQMMAAARRAATTEAV